MFLNLLKCMYRSNLLKLLIWRGNVLKVIRGKVNKMYSSDIGD